jgi:hypothetical protein
MKLDPGMHIVMHLVCFSKTGCDTWLPLHCFTRLTLQRMSTWRFIAGAHTTGARNHAGQLAHDSHRPTHRHTGTTRSSARRGRRLCADRHALN